MLQCVPFRRKQQGSVLVQFALLLAVIVALLGVIDLGYMFYAKRELQRNADLSARYAAQNIQFSGVAQSQQIVRCEQAGLESVRTNWDASSPIGALVQQVQCGEWNAQTYSGPEHFSATGSVVNAAWVLLRGESPTFFPGTWSRVIEVQAIARRDEPLATVLIRSTTVSVNGGALNTLLSALLGSQVSLDAASWQGITQLNVNLLKVSDALLDVKTNVGGYTELLDTQVTLAELVAAMVTAVEPGNVAATDLAALQRLSLLNLENVYLRLGDLIKLENTSPNAALNLGVNALELIQGALQAAAKNRALNLNLGVPGLLTTKLKVIEPSQLAVIGNPMDGSVKIEARTAQVRLWVALNTSSSPVEDVVNSVLGLVVDLLKQVLKILVDIELLPEFRNLNQLKLDIVVDVARGYARVEKADCQSAEYRLDLDVRKAGADVYVGYLDGATLEKKEQLAFGSGMPAVKPLTIIDLGSRVCVVLSLICGKRTEGSYGNIRLGGHLQVLPEQKKVSYSGVQINAFGELEQAPMYHNPLPKSIASISGMLQGANLIDVNIEGAGVTGAQKTSLVSQLLDQVLKPVLMIFDPLAPLLDGLLQALGIQLSQMEVAPYLQCGGRSELVY